MGRWDDQVEIEVLMVRYATGIDTKDDEVLRSCFTDSVRADYGNVGMFSGADEIVAFMATAHETMVQTYHRISNVVATIDGENATARSYVHAVLVVTSELWIEVTGHYDDQLVRSAEGWQISERRVTIARMLTSGAEPG